MVASTLEWLADHCPDAAVYEAAAAAKLENLTACHEVEFALKETFRGAPPETAGGRYCRGQSPPAPTEPEIVEPGDRFLICFQRYEDGTKRIVQMVNLSKPQTAGVTHVAVTSDLKLLTDGGAILKTFRDRIRKRPRAEPVRIGDFSKDNRFELQPGMEPWPAVYGGSSCYLRIPKDLLPGARANGGT